MSAETAPNPSVALARVLVDELARCGLTDAVIAPGSRSAPLAMALAADGRIRLHVRIDERSAAFLALGLARGADRPVAVVCTSGTAAANFHPAVLEAHESRVPLLVLTADRPPELRGTGANQTTDQVKLYGQAVRWFCEVGVPEARAGMVAYWRSMACRAWAEASGTPAGPVHLNLALREPLTPEPGGEGFPEPLDGRDDGAPWVSVSAPTPSADPDLVDDLAARVASAQRGLLVVGETRADPFELVAFADLLGWPIIAEAHSGARQGANAIPMYHHLLSAPAFAEAHRPDFVIRIGRTGLSRPLAGWLDASVPQLLVDPDGAWLDPARSVSELVVAEPATLLGQVGQSLFGLESDDNVEDWNASWRYADRCARAAVDELLDAEGLSEPRVARDLAAALAPGATLVVGSSMPIRDLDQTMAPRGDVRVLANRGVSGIDGFVSTAVGVSLAVPGHTVALCGDLSLLHDANGLLGAEADLTLVVVNNDGGGIFSFLPQARHRDSFERLFGTPHGADLEALARAYGAAYERVSSPERLTELARGGTGVRLAEVRTDRAANVALHQRLRDAATAALER